MEQTTLSTSMKEVVFGDLEPELSGTRRVLERLPEEHFTWKPHEKSMTLGALASHLVNVLYYQTVILRQEELDLATIPQTWKGYESKDQMLRGFNQRLLELREAVESTDDKALTAAWSLKRGDHIFFSQPKLQVLRRMGINHMIHHRAQLGVYLRLLNVPVPAIYGQTADEGFPT